MNFALSTRKAVVTLVAAGGLAAGLTAVSQPAANASHRPLTQVEQVCYNHLGGRNLVSSTVGRKTVWCNLGRVTRTYCKQVLLGRDAPVGNVIKLIYFRENGVRIYITNTYRYRYCGPRR